MTEQKLPFSQWNPIIAENFVKKWEGLSLKAYKCTAGTWTIDMVTRKAFVRVGYFASAGRKVSPGRFRRSRRRLGALCNLQIDARTIHRTP